MSIYDRIGISSNQEITSLRNYKSKTFKTDTKGIKKLVCFGRNIHFLSPSGMGENPDVEELEDIDHNLVLANSNKRDPYDQHWVSPNADIVSTFRSGGSTTHYMSVRPFIDSSCKIDISLDEVKANNIAFRNIDNFQQCSKSSNCRMYHKVMSTPYYVDFITDVDGLSDRHWIKTNYPLTSFSITDRIRLSGMVILNDYELSGVGAAQVKIYSSNSFNKFIIQLSGNSYYTYCIPEPIMMTENVAAPSYCLTHKLIENSAGEIYYTKATTTSGNNWLLEKSPPFLIDTTIEVSGSSEDGMLESQESGVSEQAAWDASRDAATADNITKDVANLSPAIDAQMAFDGKSTYMSTIRRCYFIMDTSDVPDAETINSATFSVYTSVTHAGSGSLVSSNCSIALDIGDWDTVGYTEYASRIEWKADTQENIFTLNATGLSHINKAGDTHFAILDSEFDIDDVAPNVGQDNAKGIYFSENGNQYYPHMDITYGEAAAVPSHTSFETPQHSGATHAALGWTWNSGQFNVASGMRATSVTPTTWEWAVISSSASYFYPSGGPTHWEWVSGNAFS